MLEERADLEVRLAGLESPRSREALDTEVGELEFVLRALAVLKTCVGPVPRPIAAAVRRILSGLRLWPEADGFVGWSVTIAVPADAAVLMLGPLSGRIAGVGSTHGVDAKRRMAGMPTMKHEELIRRILVDGQSVAAAALALGLKASSAQLYATKALQTQLGLNKTTIPALLNGAPSDVRRLVAWRLGLCEPVVDWDEAWVELVTRAYMSDDLTWTPRTWQLNNETRQRANDYLNASGGFVRLKTAAPGCGVGSAAMHRFGRKEGDHPPTLVLLDAPLRRGETTMGLASCRHCGERMHRVLRVPESAILDTALICDRCHHLDTAKKVRFPDSYFAESRRPTSAEEDRAGTSG